jgi:hypothetical protein
MRRKEINKRGPGRPRHFKTGDRVLITKQSSRNYLVVGRVSLCYNIYYPKSQALVYTVYRYNKRLGEFRATELVKA